MYLTVTANCLFLESVSAKDDIPVVAAQANDHAVDTVEIESRVIASGEDCVQSKKRYRKYNINLIFF